MFRFGSGIEKIRKQIIMDKNKFFDYFMNAPIEEQVEIFNGLKKVFEDVLQSRSAETEKRLLYIKDIYKAHFNDKPVAIINEQAVITPREKSFWGQ
jgi:hypothetical protein